MRVTYNWLKEFVRIDISIPELSDRLTMSGLEVENVEYINGKRDAVIELAITPNRADCLSVIGIAREVSALTGAKILLSSPKVTEGTEKIQDNISIAVNEPDICMRYCSRLISGVEIGPSPDWLQERLKAVDIKSINNVVDATNFVLIEMGNPIHAFDYDKIEGKSIIARMAEQGEKFTSLDKSEYELTEDMLVIADKKKPVALAGIVGGANSEVTDNTRNILLEAAFFNPKNIRRTSKRLGIHTESSHRFERGVDHECIIRVIDRVASLIQQLAGGTIAKGFLDIYPSPAHIPPISLRINRLNRALNLRLDRAAIENYLNRLSLCTAISPSDDPETIQVAVPSFRKDITREIDLIEEVARLHGYDNIPSEIPLSRMSSYHKDENGIFEKRIKDILSINGFYEVVNYSFVSENLFKDIYAVPDYQSKKAAIQLKNPLTKEWNIMRTTLTTGLLQTISNNMRKGNTDISIFEIGKIFLDDREENMLACAVTRYKQNSLWTKMDDKRSFFDIKGMLETILACSRIEDYALRPAANPIFVKRDSADIYIGDACAGTVGEINADALERFDIGDTIYLFEINLDTMIKAIKRDVRFTPLPKYPCLLRDVALIVDKKVKSEDILNTIEDMRPPILKEINMFDYYEGKPIPQDKKNLAYSLVYRADDMTLTEEQVDMVHDEIINRLKKRLGVTFRE